MAQQPSYSLLHWLYTNAPAAWLSALIAFSTLLLVLSNRVRPQKLVIREVGKSSLIRIWPRVREKIKLTFADNPIENLGQIDLDILNSGAKVIQNPKFTLTLPAESKVLDVHVTPESLKPGLTIDKNAIFVGLDWLNPFHEHKQIVALAVLVDGPTGPIKVSGMGEGWSIKHEKHPSSKSRWIYRVTLGSAVIGMLLTSLLYLSWVTQRFHIGLTEVSWRAAKYGAPSLIPLAVFLFWFSRFEKKWTARPRAWQTD